MTSRFSTEWLLGYQGRGVKIPYSNKLTTYDNIRKANQCLKDRQIANFKFDAGESVHHHTIQINQATRCNSFRSLLLEVYVSLNMFRAPPRPSSGAYNYINSLCFYLWSVAVTALLVVVWSVDNRPDHDQQHCYHHAPTVKPEAVNAVVSSWLWAWRRQKHVERHKTSSNKLVKLLHLVG